MNNIKSKDEKAVIMKLISDEQTHGYSLDVH